MEYKEYILSKKYYLKGLSKQIREYKNELRQYYDDRNNMLWSDVEKKYKGRYSYQIESDIKRAKYEFRHEHIAYCLAKKTRNNVFDDSGNLTKNALEHYNKIERVVNENNEPNWDNIRGILKTYPGVSEVHDEEIVCADEK